MKKDADRLITGIFRRNIKGFGFVIQDKSEGDIFISHDKINYAMDGDLVQVVLIKDAGTASREGEIISVVERSKRKVVGNVAGYGNKRFLVPDDQKLDWIFLDKSQLNGAEIGDKVVILITSYPGNKLSAEGVVTEVLGHASSPTVRRLGLMREYGIPEEFPEECEHEASELVLNKDAGTDNHLEESLLQGRRDLRDLKIITIDGAEAKDLDDAVSIQKTEEGNYLLGVHIADVSHYVKENSSLDAEAYKRGCSVYLIDYVAPMLPKAISNGVCSLNPGEDKLTLSVEMEIDKRGEVISHDIFESVICSSERMVYTDVSEMLENGDKKLIERYKDIYPDLLIMDELRLILNEARYSKGSIDFDIDESRIELNEDHMPVFVGIEERRTANRLIEEFMLIANQTVAEHFCLMDVPFIYRVHEVPSADKMAELKIFLGKLGYSLKGKTDNMHPNALCDILDSCKGKSEAVIINRVMIRSMKKAFYTSQCLGHFGLGMKYYCHFTSPIRRYPDLMIHRIIKEVIKNGILSSDRDKMMRSIVEEASEQSSICERISIEAERAFEKINFAEYMSSHVGEEYEGIVSGVVSSGFFVELQNSIEGFVKASMLLDDYYVLDPRNYRMIGNMTGNQYVLGQRVKVRVDSVDTFSSEIDFSLIKNSSKAENKKTTENNKSKRLKSNGKRREDKSKDARSKHTSSKDANAGNPRSKDENSRNSRSKNKRSKSSRLKDGKSKDTRLKGEGSKDAITKKTRTKDIKHIDADIKDIRSKVNKI